MMVGKENKKMVEKIDEEIDKIVKVVNEADVDIEFKRKLLRGLKDVKERKVVKR